MISFFKTTIFEPLYNLLVFVIGLSPLIDAGIAVVFVTLLVRFILFPLSRKAILTQQKLRIHQDELKEIREKHKEDRQKQAEAMLAFYKEKEINPFSSILLILIQLPVIISLYFIFLRSELPEIQLDLLYSFVSAPETVSMTLLGVYDISGKSIILALLAGVTSFVQLKLSMPPLAEKKDKPSFKDDLARNMNLQMRYVFPFIIGIIAYMLSAVVALYLLTSNVFTIGQELYLLKYKKAAEKAVQDRKKDQENEDKEDSSEKEKKNNKKGKKGRKKNKYGKR